MQQDPFSHSQDLNAYMVVTVDFPDLSIEDMKSESAISPGLGYQQVSSSGFTD